MRYLFIIVLFLSILDAKIYRDGANFVIDDTLKLMWQDNKDNVTVLKTHEDAHQYCNELTLGEYTNWRVPEIEEFESIVYKKNEKTNINFAFRFNLRDGYWASRALWRTFWFYADYMYFVSGTPYYDSRHKLKYVRCVRDY